jgi:hypothetical protein
VPFLVLVTLAVKRMRGRQPESSEAVAADSEPAQAPDPQ